jgi:shikimate dehydrogenase
MTALVVLFGEGIGYSASPTMHAAAFAALGIDARYELRDVAPAGLAAEVDALRGRDRLGANVTKPHKLAVCDMVDELAPEVARLGAANTIVHGGDRLVAHNTDLAAVTAELRELAGESARPIRTAVVLGAGGASRAVCAALEDLAIPRVEVLNRQAWDALPGAVAGADLLINATPIGTASDETPVPPPLLRPDLAVLDLVYRPSPSRLVRDALGVGAPARGGAGMLLRQAAASFTLWTGREAPLDVMRAALDTELGVAAHA